MCEEKLELNVSDNAFLFVGRDSQGQPKTWECSANVEIDDRWSMLWHLEASGNTVDFVDDGDKRTPVKDWDMAPEAKDLNQVKRSKLALIWDEVVYSVLNIRWHVCHPVYTFNVVIRRN